MTKDEALKLALEALEADPLEMVADVDGHMVFLKDQAITAIKEALAQPEQKYHAVNAVHKGQQCYVNTQSKEPEQDGECKYCKDGCPACDARKLPNDLL